MEISIIIPVYNKIPYLEGLLEQVRTQTFGDFECLLIDDGSTDGSGAVCDRFAAMDDRLRVFHTPNGGVSNARNLGLDHATGRFVTFIDADDRIHPDYLKQLYRCAVESGAAFVLGNLEKVWKERTEILPMSCHGLVSMERLLPEFARTQRETGLYGFCAGKLLRRELIGSARFNPRIRLAEDLDFYLDIYPRLDAIYFDPVPRYFYLQGADNSSMQQPDDRIDYFTQLTIQRKLLRFLVERQVFSGENREIQTKRLYDYVFFCLFHTDPAETGRMCRRIRNLELPPRIYSRTDALGKQAVLWLYEKKCDRLLAILLAAYRGGRRLWRGRA